MITIKGQTPPKKNSRQTFMSHGRIVNIPSQRYKAWEEEALYQLIGTVPITKYPIEMQVTFYVKDKRGRDMDNMLSSVLDCLQKADVLESDDWQHISKILLLAGGVDKDNPRVEILTKGIKYVDK
jgi:Holliday junction resolvase RusA-like endonuclease